MTPRLLPVVLSVAAIAAAGVLVLLAIILVTAHGGKGARQIAHDRFPDHCRPVTIRTRHPNLPNDSLAYADRSRCLILFDPRIHDYSRAWRCSALVHEYGHLAGRGHQRRYPRGIMYPRLNLYGGCR